MRVKSIQIELEYDIKSTVPCERFGRKIITVKLLSPTEIKCEWDDTQGLVAAASAILANLCKYCEQNEAMLNSIYCENCDKSLAKEIEAGLWQ